MNIVETLAARIVADCVGAASPYFVAICGWADTGKSTLAAELCEELKRKNVRADWISTDAFLKNRAKRNKLGISGYNPLLVDAIGLSSAVKQLAVGREYTYFPYDNRIGQKLSSPKTIRPESTIVFEGIHAFHGAIRELCTFRVFIDSDVETLSAMRIRANKVKRGMTDAEASMYIDNELQDFCEYLLPVKNLANISVHVSMQFEYKVLIDKI